MRPPSAVVFADSNTFNAELRLVDRNGIVNRAGSARPYSAFMALTPIGSRTLAQRFSISAPLRRTSR